MSGIDPYEQVAARTLSELQDALDAFEEEVEVELSDGILSLDFPDGAKFLINSHRAAQQIWMAANRQAWHFSFHSKGPQLWVSDKSGEELWTTLEQVLGGQLGRRVTLRPRP